MNNNMEQENILIFEGNSDYELLDSGEGEKLERYGKVILSRPDPQALWAKRLGKNEWEAAEAIFSKDIDGDKAGWKIKDSVPKEWNITFNDLKFEVKPTTFKHLGIFPEQVVNWHWLADVIGKNSGNQETEVLNLFGYTGGASLSCAKAGAKVVHLDGSKVAVNWAKKNAELSGLGDKPIRWILDDARTFVGREIKRGRQYDGIIMDPPAFGHGPENELWKIEDDLLQLIKDCFKILKDKPLFFLVNGYSAGYSALAYQNILLELKAKFGGAIEIGELTIMESKKNNLPQRLLPCGIYVRWTKS